MRSQRGLPGPVMSGHEFRSGAAGLVVLTDDDGAVVCAAALGTSDLRWAAGTPAQRTVGWATGS